MRSISASLRRLVTMRAYDRCEYCGLAQVGQAGTFHIDHVQPMAAGGETTAENLALACISCSLRKGARQEAIDPLTGIAVQIFSPRSQIWNEHFSWDGVCVVGLSSVGRSTIAALGLNRANLLAIRGEEAFFKRHPPW